MPASAKSVPDVAHEPDVFTGLFGYGWAVSYNAPNLESCASVGKPPLSEQGSSPRNAPFIKTAVTFASGFVSAGQDEVRSVGSGTGAGGDPFIAKNRQWTVNGKEIVAKDNEPKVDGVS